MKQYIGFSNDHSGSMAGIIRAAANDYNATIAAIQSAATQNSLDTIVNVVQCGIRTKTHTAAVVRQIVNSNVHVLKPITTYEANGSATPLFDSVGEVINLLKSVPDANDPEVSFLVFVTTDGGENSSLKWNGRTLSDEIRRLQATGRWTFVFRVPRGGTRTLTSLGIPAGNIQEWDQTNRGVEVSTAATTQAFNDYYAMRASGKKSSSSFYANLSQVTANDVKAVLKDISGDVSMFYVDYHEDGQEIRPFIEAKTNKALLKGAAFYQLTKTESRVQDQKLIVIRDKTSGAVYYGPAARQMIGLPTSGTARLHPGDHGQFDIFIQSTSVNRKLVAGTQVMYWPRVGVAFTEGPSYQPAASAAIQKAAAPVAPVIVATQAAAVKAVNSGKLRVVRKKDGVLVKEVSTLTEALELIAKAKRGKKAALVIEGN